MTNYHAQALAEALEPTMTFAEFARMNRTRCEAPDGFKHKLLSWSTSDWFLAMLGELGEAANVAKKLNRVRDGIPGNKETPEVLQDKLRKELGDVFVYLDLTAQALGFMIGDAAQEVFDSKSREIGYEAFSAYHASLKGGEANDGNDTAKRSYGKNRSVDTSPRLTAGAIAQRARELAIKWVGGHAIGRREDFVNDLLTFAGEVQAAQREADAKIAETVCIGDIPSWTEVDLVEAIASAIRRGEG